MKALIVVDPQNDFCEGGSLEVPNSNEIIPIINKLTKLPKYELVIFTQDWHPHNHKSFASQHRHNKTFDLINLNGIKQILWPDHCVMDTKGAEFHKDIDMNIRNLYIFKKGTNVEIDSYSGFYENDHKTSTGLTKFLKNKGITEIDIVGLALDFCVKSTAVDGKKDGFKTNVLLRACKAITDDITPHLNEMKKIGIKIKKNIRLK